MIATRSFCKIRCTPRFGGMLKLRHRNFYFWLVAILSAIGSCLILPSSDVASISYRVSPSDRNDGKTPRRKAEASKLCNIECTYKRLFLPLYYECYKKLTHYIQNFLTSSLWGILLRRLEVSTNKRTVSCSHLKSLFPNRLKHFFLQSIISKFVFSK